jgi:hypothetical protein
MKMNKPTAAIILLLLIAIMQCGIAQTVPTGVVSGQAPATSTSPQAYQLPFASTGNTVELTVANTATTPLTGVKVTATDVPPWLKFTATEQRIALLKAQQEMAATFTFSVDKAAPVQKNQTIKFVITAPSGEKWTKEITVAVAAPAKFEVYQNYPNPFNPTTAISYQLTAVSKVSLKIYNLLGQEVASLVDADRLAGYHQEMWDATRCASGVYIYQLIATDERGSKQVARKRMLLLK